MRDPIRLRVQQKVPDFTPSELKIANVLLSSYPSSGLTSLSNLAAQAGVSDPTVYRMLVKLGFDGFPEFQQALLAEVDERMNSPLSMLEGLAPDYTDDDVQKSVFRHLAVSLAKVAEQGASADFRAAIDLLADTRQTVLCCGGRASAFLAWRLASHLNQIRPRTMQIEPSIDRASASLMDMTPGTVLVVYDFRRYQETVVHYALEAKKRGARIVLFTDEWKSPISSVAEITLTSAVQNLSPFDTKVPALAQCEALMAALLRAIPEQARTRMRELETLRQIEGARRSELAE
ncbi:MurR/RpiR family transcriptional regulator [Paraburkholderia susongensis]|uniref:Transcriptional regulator, RpiR family n=1 Tax=Paraburkholderia susongensis TaxID=1515439 RepID=A0A1X7L7E3_9BURK|nr:MurR/RpiR family transcriptional regulator [Paraburkholderia susongensis]SMG49771.1 transcriptional regulator, RpiR family [Paraburkholderia susongensis]